ncbi:MAG: hypothetical protein WC988_02675 [Patescibacteria group bacterium]
MNKIEQRSLVFDLSKEYRKASKKRRSAILNNLSNLTTYSRKHLMELLADILRPKTRIRRNRASKYGNILKPLTDIWHIANFSCGQRLAPMMKTYLQSLENFGEINLQVYQKTLLLQISPASIDRLLKHERKKINLKSRSRTKPGTLLKQQIPIKMWTDWDNAQPGFLEIDSVHHCGGSNYGYYLYTLDTTDVATGWNECRAHLGKSEEHTVSALNKIRERLPFKLLGIDFDTGGEFVNWHLVRYCRRNQISYTRSREGVKNDQAYIEQQNFSVVRRFVGYGRFDTEEQLEIINDLYEKLSDYQNFFQAVMRLKSKVRDGARVSRKYSTPKTAYQRVIEHPNIDSVIRKKLTERFKALNPKKLLEEIVMLSESLYGHQTIFG